MSGGLEVLQRLRDSPPRPPEPIEERCELCPSPLPGRHGHLVDLEARSLLCACRGCYLLFTSTGRAVTATGPCPRSTAGSPGSRSRRPSGTACRSRSAWPSSSSTRPSAAWPPSTRARPGRPSPSCPSAPGRSWPARTPSWPPCVPTWRRSWCGPTGPGTAIEGFVVPIDACYELVGRLRMSWRGFDGGSEARDHLGGILRLGAGAGPMTGLSLRVREARVERHAAVPTIILVLDGHRDPGCGGRGPGPAVPGPHRAPAAAVLRRGGCAALRAVRRAGPVGRLAAAVPVDPHLDGGAPVRLLDPGRAPARLHLRLRRGRGQVPGLAVRR